MKPTLYSGPLSMFGAKAQIAALEKGVDLDVVLVHFDFQNGYSPKHPEVLRINPKRQVPVLVHDGLEIFDSTQIFEYLEDLQPEPPLWPREPKARARARLLELKSDEVFFPHIIKLMGLQQDLQSEPAQAAIAAATDYYAQMDALLQDRDWLAGDYGNADITFFMAALFGERMNAPLGPQVPRLRAWRERVAKRAAVQQVVAPMGRWLAANGRPWPAVLDALIPL
jgi:glutathione S-transferase